VIKLDLERDARGCSQPRARIRRKESKPQGVGACHRHRRPDGPHGPHCAGHGRRNGLGFIRDPTRGHRRREREGRLQGPLRCPKRFMADANNQRGCYNPGAVYAPVTRTLTRKQFGAYVLVGVRTLVNPNIPGDTETVHALQDGVKIEQPGGPGKFEIPGATP
jgi:hypothetical protein